MTREADANYLVLRLEKIKFTLRDIAQSEFIKNQGEGISFPCVVLERNMIVRKKADLSVIMKAKDMCRYIMTATEKSPKKYRFTFTTRMQNMSMDIIEDLYAANDIHTSRVDPHTMYEKRQQLQREAISKTRMLTYIAQLALEQQAILPKQYEQIAVQSTELINLAYGWKNSDEQRYIEYCRAHHNQREL